MKCPYCIDGKAWEINYRYWTEPDNAPKTLDEVIDERECSYCRGTGIKPERNSK